MSTIVVVGSGIAGLTVALRASARHDVILVTKAALEESNTRYAQGGIAAALFADDSVESHVEDTLRAAAGLGNRVAVEVLCSEGPQRIRDLIELGVQFDMEGGELARGLEAAHSAARVVHAGGDATGLSVVEALTAAVRRSRVRILERTFLADLLSSTGRIGGVELVGPAGETFTLAADAVVLATGGAGQMYAHTTNPAVATGDGLAAAIRAGAVVENLEFVQFHPTSLAVQGNPLISEAVRGEGAVLLDSRGRRFMPAVHPGAELAPRDVVARGIAAQMAAQDGAPVFLDATGRGREFLAARFPSLSRLCLENGLDWAKEPIPVTPAAHYWMGGIRTDLWGRTSIPGLFAVGEVASTGVHGANRLASNSLLEGLVFGWRLNDVLGDDWPDTVGSEVEDDSVLPLAAADTLAEAPVDRAALQRLAWGSLGLVRDGDSLARANVALASLSTVESASVRDREDANLLLLARAVGAAAEHRIESRGAHYRSDYPHPSPTIARSFSWARKATVPC